MVTALHTHPAGRPLTADERADLERLETTVRRGRENFRAVCLAMLEIMQKRLYREWGSFDDYLPQALGDPKALGLAARTCGQGD
jgi:hypothetical protein